RGRSQFGRRPSSGGARNGAAAPGAGKRAVDYEPADERRHAARRGAARAVRAYRRRRTTVARLEHDTERALGNVHREGAARLFRVVATEGAPGGREEGGGGGDEDGVSAGAVHTTCAVRRHRRSGRSCDRPGFPGDGPVRIGGDHAKTKARIVESKGIHAHTFG